MKRTHISLGIKSYELPVFLGWPATERAKKQVVLLDIDFFSTTPPKACITDDLTDTICYDSLLKNIRKHFTKKKFRLLEHLTFEIFQFVKKELHFKAKVKVTITKYPAIPGLKKGATFTCWDK